MSDPIDIFNWRRLDGRVTTSGQPTEAQLGELKRLGVDHVVNLGLHTHERALPDEAATLAALGIAYIHIPVDFEEPTDGDFARFRDVMVRLDGERVHVHCIANLRVSAFLYRLWCEMPGRDGGEARRLMESVWRPGGVWATFVGDRDASSLPHRPPVNGGR